MTVSIPSCCAKELAIVRLSGSLSRSGMNSPRTCFGPTASTASAAQTELSIRCVSEFSLGACPVQGTLQLDLHQAGPTLGGSGEWTASGSCPPLGDSQGQTIELSAVRRSTVPAGACTGPSSLAQKLISNPAALWLR